MARKIHLADGRTVEVDCLSCAVVNGVLEPTGGVVMETKYFHAHQDLAYPIPGLVIMASKRHFYGLDELTESEAHEYIAVMRRIRQAQRAALGISHVYYFYNEDTTHHFHTWMVPRHDWMKPFGRSIESVRPILLHARNTMTSAEQLSQLKSSIAALRDALQDLPAK